MRRPAAAQPARDARGGPSAGAAGSRLTILAGPEALRLVRANGLPPGLVDLVLGASGGPKWIALHGIDRFLATFLPRRDRPLPLVGSSIGAWRLAALAQRDAGGALARFREAYLEQRYPSRPPPSRVTEVSRGVLDALLGASGAAEILASPWARLHVVVTRARGPMASERPAVQGLGLAAAALANAASRRTLALSFERVVFHASGPGTGSPGPPGAVPGTAAGLPFGGWRDLATRYVGLDGTNLRPALLASGSIPLVLQGVAIPGEPGAVFRDGGIVDYHLDVDEPPGDGIVLYPHFSPHVVPGWFDKALGWRRAPARRLRRTLLVAPSPELLARLPGGRIPDRKDFGRLPDAERLRAWDVALSESEAMGEEFAELVATGRIAERVQPFP